MDPIGPNKKIPGPSATSEFQVTFSAVLEAPPPMTAWRHHHHHSSKITMNWIHLHEKHLRNLKVNQKLIQGESEND